MVTKALETTGAWGGLGGWGTAGTLGVPLEGTQRPEKGTATHSSVLAWRSPGTEEPGGLPSMGSHKVGHD